MVDRENKRLLVGYRKAFDLLISCMNATSGDDGITRRTAEPSLGVLAGAFIEGTNPPRSEDFRADIRGQTSSNMNIFC
jgi:hypothetical protein